MRVMVDIPDKVYLDFKEKCRLAGITMSKVLRATCFTYTYNMPPEGRTNFTDDFNYLAMGKLPKEGKVVF